MDAPTKFLVLVYVIRDQLAALADAADKRFGRDDLAAIDWGHCGDLKKISEHLEQAIAISGRE